MKALEYYLLNYLGFPCLKSYYSPRHAYLVMWPNESPHLSHSAKKSRPLQEVKFIAEKKGAILEVLLSFD